MKTEPAELKSVIEVCLYSKNLKQAEAFYGKKLGFELISSSDTFRFFRVGNQMLLIFDADSSRNQSNLPPHFAHGQQHIAFLSNEANYAVWKEHLKNCGVKIEAETVWPNSGLRSFYFRDPENHVLEILEGNIWF
ncbi:MAG: VOC family protein [Luteibaculum sp.]